MAADTSPHTLRWRKYSIVLAILALIIFSPMAFVQSYVLTKAMADFVPHIAYAQEIKNGIAIPSYILAHAGWEVLLLLFNALLGLQLRTANFAAVLLCEIVTVFALFQLFWPTFKAKDLPLWKQALITLGVSVATPISAFWVLDQKFYLGYVGISSYHNPTILLLRPLALLQFIFSLKCFGPHPISKLEILGMAIVSMLAAFAKPNFAICLIPAMGLLVLYNIIRKKQASIVAFSYGFVLPTMLTLAIQFLMSYYDNGSSSIVFAPFAVMNSYSKFLLIKFLLSIVFPVMVTIRYRREAWYDIRLILAWLIFIFGSFYTYFLAENGGRFFDGNFTWSSEIALFVLFAAASAFFWDVAESSHKSRWFLLFIWLCHVTIGIIYYGYFLTAHIYA
jgi:hypothetical protein